MARLRSSAWQPALLSSPVSGFALATAALIAGAAVATFAGTFEFTHKEQVRGHLRPAAGWTRVATNSSGIVFRRLAHPGDLVEAGDVLLEISSGNGLQRALTVQERMLDEIDVWRATLRARLDLVDTNYRNELELLGRQDLSDRRELARLQDEIELSEARVQLAEQRRDDAERLVQVGALAAEDLARLEEDVQSRRVVLSERKRASERLSWDLDAKGTRAAGMAVDRAMSKNILLEKLHALAMDEHRLRGEGAAKVLAPKRGIVASVRVGDGDAVHPGMTLLDILPEESALTARLFAPPEAMGFVRPGQSVRVYLDAFPYERYGAQSGRVLSLSKSAVTPDESAEIGIGPVYRVDVEFPDGLELTPIQRLALRPGMTVTADLVRDRGTLIDWMLEPLRATANRL